MSFRSVLRRIFNHNDVHINTAIPDAYLSLLEKSSDVICHVENGRFTYVSPSATRVFGWDPAALMGQEALSMVHEEDKPLMRELVARLIAGEEWSALPQCRIACADGSAKWIETTDELERIEGGYRAVLIMRDISDRKLHEKALTAIALQDGLTGLGNRRAFDQTLCREWRRTVRERGEIALLLLDIDCFKQFNDTYGHLAGDDCLRAVASCVADHSRRPDDTAYRYGGEEITVVLSGSGLGAAMNVAEAIRSAVYELRIPHEGSTCSAYVSVSIGVAAAIARVGGTTRMPESLVQAADHALYKAKAEGRNRVARSVLMLPSEP